LVFKMLQHLEHQRFWTKKNSAEAESKNFRFL